MTELKIDPTRFEDRLHQLAQIGAQGDGRGITRRALSPEEDAAKSLLTSFCEKERIPVRLDGAGNLIARIGPDGPAIVTGSHLDTVPNGGHLDGAYGVFAGLEALSCLKEYEDQLERAVELVAFTDEEGRFGSMIGSKSMSGDMDAGTLESARDESGRSLAAALKERGLSMESALSAKRGPEEIDRFVELHIEQGPVLEQRNVEIGIVENIIGIIRWRAAYRGEANHAGTTPMDMRRDAFTGLTQFSAGLPEILQEYGSPLARATIGEVALKPGYMGVVPAAAHFSLDLRDISLANLEELNRTLKVRAKSIAADCQLEFEVEEIGRLLPSNCDASMTDKMEQLAKARGYSTMRMPSGATHDAVPMSSIVPIAMIFVPSAGGLSHSPREYTAPSMLARGATLLLDTLATYALPDGLR